MENKDFFIVCQQHSNQYLMFLQIQFAESELSDQTIHQIQQNKCAQCLINEKADKKEYVRFDQFINRVSNKYKQIGEIIELMNVIKEQYETMKFNSQYKILYGIQDQMIQLIETGLIQHFNECRSEFESINQYKLQYSKQLLKLYKLKSIIQFEEKYFYELLQQSISILNNFPLLIKFQTTTKPFSFYKDSQIQYKLVKFQKQNENNQAVKSNLMKFQEKIFVFGDNIGYLYYYNHNTDVQISKKYHNGQICVIEKITEEIFCSGSNDQQVLAFRITPDDKFKLISKIILPFQTFRLRRIDNKRVATNQQNQVYILNISQSKMVIEKVLKVSIRTTEVFGILNINDQLTVLHRDGTLNFWNWRKGQLIRSHHLSKVSTQIQHVQNMLFGFQQNQNEDEESVEEDEDENEDESENDLDVNNDEENWETDSSGSFNMASKMYSRVRLLGKSMIAAVTFSNQIKIVDFKDFYFNKPPVKIQIDYIILCLESIPETDLVLIAGQSLNIYDLKQKKMLLQDQSGKNETDKYDQILQSQTLKQQFGNQGLIGGTVFNQNQLVSVKGEEIELIFISFGNNNQNNNE